jgi:CRP/FNR family transcriptional regulator, dissimilatory nitrate respiration regulator
MEDLLYNAALFRGLKNYEVDELLKETHHQIKKYKAGEYLADIGDLCDSINILIEGNVRGEIVDFKGKTIKVEDVFAPDTFAEAFLFASENNLLVDVIANTKTRVLVIFKGDLLELFQRNRQVLENYLNIVSNRFVTITNKMKFLSLKTIKGKLAVYLLARERKLQTNKNIQVHKTQEQLAEYIGVTRPALARELAIMAEEGIIEMLHKDVRILDKEKLMGLL